MRAATRISRERLAALAAAAVFVAGCSDAPPPQAVIQPPSTVVLITIDTLRADAVSFLGGEPRTTPFLEKLAADGVVFTSAYAPSSWTVPSMASLFTGLAPGSHGVAKGDVIPPGPGQPQAVAVTQPVLSDSFATLAEAFAKAGFETVGVPANVHLAQRLGFGQGFEHYFADASFWPANLVNETLGEKLLECFGAGWETAWKAKPTFVWLHYFDPHDPHYPREPWLTDRAPEVARAGGAPPANMVMAEMRVLYPHADGALAERMRPLYYAEIGFLDEHLRKLDEQIGFSADDVLLVVTADHGEEIADHGGLGHGHTLYEEVVRVPLLIRWPARVRGGRQVETPVSLLDLYPTLAEMGRLEAPPGLQGQSLAPLLLRGGEVEHRVMHFELDRTEEIAGAIRLGDWKLVAQTSPNRRVQLFDLAKDPHERTDLAAEMPGVLREMESLLWKRLQSLPPPTDVQRVGIESPALLKQLQGFGYVGEREGEGK